MPLAENIWGSFGLGPYTATADTAIAALVPPFRGPGGSSPLLYGLRAGTSDTPNWWQSALTKFTTLIYTTGGTAHTLVLLKPKNFCYFTAATAPGASILNVDKDPGLYSVNYRYRLPPGAVVSQVSDNAIAAGDYVAYQLADGTWVLDTVSSVSSLALTMATAVPTPSGTAASAGVVKGGVLFFYGVATDKDPATGVVPYSIAIAASQTQKTFQDYIVNVTGAVHPGDPIVAYSGNATAAGILGLLAGYYAAP